MLRTLRRRSFSVATGGGAAPVPAPWWLAGGIDNAHVAAWQAKGAASLGASYLKLGGLAAGYANIDPAIVGGVAPTWGVVNGWNLNSTTQYLDTGFVPIKQVSTAIMKYKSATAAPTFGTQFPGLSFESGGVYGYYISGRYVQSTNPLPYPNIWNVIGISGAKGYLNGVIDRNIPDGGDAISDSIKIGSEGTNFYPYGQYYCSHFWLSNLTLTDAQMLALSTAMAAL